MLRRSELAKKGRSLWGDLAERSMAALLKFFSSDQQIYYVDSEWEKIIPYTERISNSLMFLDK